MPSEPLSLKYSSRMPYTRQNQWKETSRHMDLKLLYFLKETIQSTFYRGTWLGSVSGACDSWFWDYKSEPHVGFTLKKQNKTML